ncbi:MAG: LysR family transcriptional regulator, partial [Pseudomonadota bacterium]
MRRQRTLEFGDLETLITVAESTTLTEAAAKLSLSQSAVSQIIKSLEDSTQTKLIVPRSRPIKLTQNGEKLRVYANQVLTSTNEIVNELAEVSIGKIPKLDLGMIDSFADSLGVHLVATLQENVARVSLRTGLNTSLSDAFLSRNIDVLITSDPLRDEAGLLRIPLIRDPFIIITPTTY